MFSRRWYAVLAAVAVAAALAVARPSSGAVGEERYVVRPGDTLWALASDRYGGDPREAIWRISRRNGLEGASLRPGMVLFLPTRDGDA